MADTIPAAVPDPIDPPSTAPAGAPSPGIFSTMLAPVGPARPTADAADTTATGSAEVPVNGASSATYHGTSDTNDKDIGGSGTAQKKGIIRAWLIAGATRWGKGGGTQNKRLDVKKAKASAVQVKEARQVSVNRSGGLFSGGSGASGKGGKAPADKGARKGPSKGPVKGPSNGSRNSNGSAHKGPSGRSGGNSGSGAGGGGSKASGGKQPGGSGTKGAKTDAGRSPKGSGAKGSAGGGAAPKPSNGASPKGGGASGNGKSGTPGQGSTNGKGTSGGGKDHKGNNAKTGTDSDRKRISLRKNPKDPTTGKDSPKGADPKGSTGTPGKGATPAPANGAGAKPTAGTDKKTDLDKKTGPDKDPTQGQKQAQPDSKGKTGQQTTSQTGKKFSTRESRETGYRDGTRIGKTAEHVRAYRDGVKDGYRDATETAAQEKARLDQAHADHKKKTKESPVTTPRTSADYHQPTTPAAPAPTGPQPITVDRIDATNLHLGAGAARPTISRGEVRTLKQLERRLGERLSELTKVAETTKAFQAHARAQASKATTLMEQAKSVKGGDSLAGKLARLAENAKAQAAKAEEIHQKAIRSADSCRAILSNVSTRYGGMYKAVVNSPETAPAEMAYYKESN